MATPTEQEKRDWFAQVLPQILAMEFPEQTDDPQIIRLLFHNEENLKIAVFFLQSYEGTGFSLLIEKIDPDRITLKIYEPDTDDFHVLKGLTVRTNILDFYSQCVKPGTYLSVGLMQIINNAPVISHMNHLKIPLKSITFQ